MSKNGNQPPGASPGMQPAFAAEPAAATGSPLPSGPGGSASSKYLSALSKQQQPTPPSQGKPTGSGMHGRRPVRPPASPEKASLVAASTAAARSPAAAHRTPASAASKPPAGVSRSASVTVPTGSGGKGLTSTGLYKQLTLAPGGAAPAPAAFGRTVHRTPPLQQQQQQQRTSLQQKMTASTPIVVSASPQQAGTGQAFRASYAERHSRAGASPAAAERGSKPLAAGVGSASLQAPAASGQGQASAVPAGSRVSLPAFSATAAVRDAARCKPAAAAAHGRQASPVVARLSTSASPAAAAAGNRVQPPRSDQISLNKWAQAPQPAAGGKSAVPKLQLSQSPVLASLSCESSVCYSDIDLVPQVMGHPAWQLLRSCLRGSPRPNG
jgi:hypothetical protein